MREVAQQAILPRFRALAAGDIEEKAPGEQVTLADRQAEAILTPALQGLVPGSRVLGEEAASQDARLYGLLDAPGDVWLVDPLDGTANFINGSSTFAVMVALVRDGQSVASWMLDPLTDRMAMAELGAGATLAGEPVRTPQASPAWPQVQGAVLTRFLPPETRRQIEQRATGLGQITPGLRCSGHEYPAVATGRQHFVLFWRLEPWDHAPGALFIHEAGGRAAYLDGSPYAPAQRRQGLLVAQNSGVWETVRAEMLEQSMKTCNPG